MLSEHKQRWTSGDCAHLLLWLNRAPSRARQRHYVLRSPPFPASYRICKLSLVFGFLIMWDGACWLTAEGAELVPTCRSLLSQADNVLEHARSLAHGDSGELNVGASPHMIASVFPGFLRQFAAKYPRVRVKTVEAGSVDQLELMRRGELHAAVGF